MSKQFVSQQSNYAVILKNGIEGNRILGTQPVAGIYVKFEGGIVTVKDESIVKMLRDHPGFGTDFIEVEEIGIDPYLDNRTELEPEHIRSEIKYGHSEAIKGTSKTKLTPQMKKIIEGEAIKMLPDLLKANPDLLRGILTSMAADLKSKDEQSIGKEVRAEENDEEKVAPIADKKPKNK